ncbi:hypothetical protein DN402_16955 [Streptomyces sp. SW4]|nr:hypothetical protein DN402_16955 [Streptomyces sp. SW4]
MHAAGSGVPTSPLTAIEAGPETSVDLKSATDARWDGSWQLSKPAAPGARVVIRDAGGDVVRTLDAVQRGAALDAQWDGTRADGTRAHNGPYTWELTAAPEDGHGPELRLDGTITVSGSGGGTAAAGSPRAAADGGAGAVSGREPVAARRETAV